MSIDIRDESQWQPLGTREHAAKAATRLVAQAVTRLLPESSAQGGAMRWSSSAGRGI